MSLMPSPVPHPLEFSPFDVPAWAYEALEWVVGFDWPAGNEVATWDIADRWYALATSLAAPNEAAMTAANQFLSGYGGEGTTAEGFDNAWRRVAGDENAPLHDLLRVSNELGRLVEGAGTDIEAAKLEAWIEIGIFLLELIGAAVTVALTLGAASPAAGGLIIATRLAVQQIFRKLIEQLGVKALKQTAGRALKQVTTREGLTKLSRKAIDEGFDEAREEIAVNGGIQLYQQSNGRSDSFDWNDLGRSAAAGFAGGAASTGSSLGSHGHGGVLRGAGGEVLAEFGAAATFGELPDAAGLAKSATSGAAGSALHTAPSALSLDGLAPPALPSVPLGDPVSLFERTGEGAPPISGVAPPATAPLLVEYSTALEGPSLSTPDAAAPARPEVNSPSPQTASTPDAPSTSSPSAATPSTTSPSTSPAADPSSPASPSPSSFSSSPLPPSPDLSPSPSSSAASSALSSAPSSLSSAPSSPATADVLSSTPTLAFADPTTAPAPSPLPSPTPATTSDPLLGSYFPTTVRPSGLPGSSVPGSPRTPLSDLDRIAEALAPRPAPPRPTPRHVDIPVLTTSRNPVRPAPPAPEVRDEQAYFGYVEHARRTHEQNRRDEYATYLDSIAEDNRIKIADLGESAYQANRAGFTLREAAYRRQALELSEIVAEIETQIDQVRSGELAPARIEVDPPDWSRINHDVGNLAPGGVRVGDRSALDGFSGRPPIDRTRRYNVVGGLRAPLAVHQVDLENAVPRDEQGRVSRLPDPRAGTWFRLANDGGPAADPTRGLNCVDGVLALFDTYIHGRPRVSAPRTFDVYAHGDPDRPLGGELEGVNRIRLATGGDFQGLCPYLGQADPAQAKPAIDQAVQNLTNHLLNTGHGAYAFILTDLEGGGSHSWAALNQNGTILFLDPQIGRISENTPMYHHHGVPTPINIVSLEALVVDASGTPTPLPNHGPGNWSTTPTGTDPTSSETHTQQAERLAIDSLLEDQRILLDESLVMAESKARDVSRDLHRVLAWLADSTPDVVPRIVNEDHRVKGLGSLARKFLTRVRSKNLSAEAALASIKDRVRFSVEVPHWKYGETVLKTLGALEGLGYRVAPLEIFWAAHGRHNGLNVNLTAPDGFVLEVQFPTPASLRIGNQTHAYYENVRDETLAPDKRVEAFLAILSINKHSGIYQEQPHGLDLLSDLADAEGPIDTTLARWLRGRRALTAAYIKHLSSTGTTFEEALRRYDLDLEDVPGMAGLGLVGD